MAQTPFAQSILPQLFAPSTVKPTAHPAASSILSEQSATSQDITASVKDLAEVPSTRFV
jgi:hypothetical protein